MNPLRACAIALLWASTATAAATTLYTWKDANGVSHYAQNPPTDQRYQARRIDSADVAAPEGAPTPAAASAQCSRARDNLKLLQGQQPVLHDSDGDGKPDTALDQKQRLAQRDLTEAAIRAYCPAPAETS